MITRFALLALLAISGCGDALTEIIVEVDSDLTDLDRVVVTVSRDGESPKSSMADLDGDPLPRSVTLHHTGGALGPVHVVVTGEVDGRAEISVERRVTFVEEESVTLRVFLAASCDDASCAAPLTCGNDGRCRGVDVAACELRGDCPGGDAGIDASGDARPDAPDAPRDGDAANDVSPEADVDGSSDADAQEDATEDAGTDSDVIDAEPDGDVMDSGTDDADADMPDADADATPDADADADAGPCVLNGGVCGVFDRQLPGDTVTYRPCDTLPPGVTVAYRTEFPDSSAMVGATVTLTQLGAYAVTATATGGTTAPGCMATRTVATGPFTAVTAAMPTASMRDLAARVGMAFVATDMGPYAVVESGWRDLEVGASGTVVSQDLQTVAVRSGEAIFGARIDAVRLTRATVADGFSAIAFTDLTLPSAGDLSTYAMAVRPSSAVNGDTSPLIVATAAGIRMFAGTLTAGGTSTAPQSNTFAATVDVGIGSMSASNRGDIWALSASTVDNFDTDTGGVAFALGGSAGAGTAPTSLLVEDRDATKRLIIGRAGSISLYNLATDWSLLTALPAATTVSFDAVDLAHDASGDFWAIGSGGLARVSIDGAIITSIPMSNLALIATSWNATTREIWLLTSTGTAMVLSAGR